MIPLLILGGVLVVVAVLLLAPVRLEVTFREEFTLSVRYLFFRFPLFPGEDQEEQEAPTHEETASKEGEPSKPSLGQKLRVILRREGLQGFLQTLKELSQEVGNASKKLLKQVRLKRFDLYICLGGEEDAAAAAALPEKIGFSGFGLQQPGGPCGFFWRSFHTGVVFVGSRAYTTV